MKYFMVSLKLKHKLGKLETMFMEAKSFLAVVEKLSLYLAEPYVAEHYTEIARVIEVTKEIYTSEATVKLVL